MNWNDRCREAIKEEKKEIESRYQIRFGQTEVYCLRCGKPCVPGNHTCMDLRFEALRAKKDVKKDVTLSQAEFRVKIAPGTCRTTSSEF